MLQHRFKGKIVSHNQGQSRSNILLTNIQKKVLIKHINKLSAHNMHPIIQTVKNLIREIIRHSVKKR